MTISKQNIIKTGKAANGIAGSSAGGSNKPSISIVHNKNGKRIKFSSALLRMLGNPKSVQFITSEEGRKLYISEFFSENQEDFNFSEGDPQIIYNGRLTAELVQVFSLDYSKATSKSFDANVTTDDEDDSVIAVVDMQD